MVDKAVEAYIQQQKEQYDTAHQQKKRGDKEVYAPMSMVHWTFRQVLLNRQDPLPLAALDYLLSHETFDQLHKRVKESIAALSSSSAIKNRQNVRLCFAYHVGTEASIKELAKDQTFSWLFDFLLASYQFYSRSKRQDYVARIKTIQSLICVRIQQTEQYGQLDAFAKVMIQKLSSKPTQLTACFVVIVKLLEHTRFSLDSKSTFVANLLSSLAQSFSQYTDQSKIKLFQRLQLLMEKTALSYERNFEFQYVVKGYKKTMRFENWWQFAAIAPNTSEALQQMMVELLLHNKPVSGLDTLIKGEPLLLTWIKLGAYPAVAVLLRHVKREGLNLSYEHSQYGFDFRTECLDGLESWIGYCYDQNPKLEQALSSIYMALVNFFKHDDETYLLESTSSPSATQAPSQEQRSSQEAGPARSQPSTSGAASWAKPTSGKTFSSMLAGVSKPWCRPSRSNSVDFVRTNPLRRASQEHLFKRKGGSTERLSQVPESEATTHASSGFGLSKDIRAGVGNIKRTASPQSEPGGASHALTSPDGPSQTKKKRVAASGVLNKATLAPDQHLADFIEEDEDGSSQTRKRTAEKSMGLEQVASHDGPVFFDEEGSALRPAGDESRPLTSPAHLRSSHVDAASPKKRARQSEVLMDEGLTSIQQLASQKVVLRYPLQRDVLIPKDQKTVVFFRGIHNQIAPPVQGLWAEACTLGDRPEEVRRQLQTLSTPDRHLFQQVYTNDMDRFLDRVRSDEGLLGVKVSGRPFISTSTEIGPALAYALGQKWSGKAKKKQCLSITYSPEGVPSHTGVGHLYVIMMSEQHLKDHEWHHVMAMYAGGAAINYRIVAEAEISHVAQIPKSCVAMSIPITMPDFSKPSMPPEYRERFGYQACHYQAWQALCQQSSDHAVFAQQVIADMKTWIVQSLEAEIDRLIANRVYPCLFDERLQSECVRWHTSPHFGHIRIARILHYMHLAREHLAAWEHAGVSLAIYLRGFSQVLHQGKIESGLIQCLLHLLALDTVVDKRVVDYYKQQIPLFGRLMDELPAAQETLLSIHHTMLQQSKHLPEEDLSWAIAFLMQEDPDLLTITPSQRRTLLMVLLDEAHLDLAPERMSQYQDALIAQQYPRGRHVDAGFSHEDPQEKSSNEQEEVAKVLTCVAQLKSTVADGLEAATLTEQSVATAEVSALQQALPEMDLLTMQYQDLIAAVKRGDIVFVEAYLQKVRDGVNDLSLKGKDRATILQTFTPYVASSNVSTLGDDKEANPLHYAAGWRDGEVVAHQPEMLDLLLRFRLLHNLSFSMSAELTNGQRLDHLLAINGASSHLKHALTRYAYYNASELDHEGLMSMHYAVSCGHLDVVRILVKTSDFARESRSGKTPYQLAEEMGAPGRAIQEFLRPLDQLASTLGVVLGRSVGIAGHIIKVDTSELEAAINAIVAHGDSDQKEAAVQYCVGRRAPLPPWAKSQIKKNIAFLACQGNRRDLVKALLALGVDLNASPNRYLDLKRLRLPYFYVLRKGYKKMLKIMLDANPLLLFKTSGEYADTRKQTLSDDTLKVIREIPSAKKKAKTFALVHEVFLQHQEVLKEHSSDLHHQFDEGLKQMHSSRGAC